MLTAPKGETIWVQYVNDGAITHVITSTQLRDIYYLYKVVDGKLIKTKHKSENPPDLEKYIDKGE